MILTFIIVGYPLIKLMPTTAPHALMFQQAFCPHGSTSIVFLTFCRGRCVLSAPQLSVLQLSAAHRAMPLSSERLCNASYHTTSGRYGYSPTGTLAMCSGFMDTDPTEICPPTAVCLGFRVTDPSEALLPHCVFRPKHCGPPWCLLRHHPCDPTLPSAP